MPGPLARAPERPLILLAGGTDPSGGAGLFADGKAVAAMGGHGLFAVTAVTVQDSGRVHSWTPLPVEQIRAQMEAVCNDGRLDGMKTGMLGGPEAVEVAARIYGRRVFPAPLIVDPVLVSGSGHSLFRQGVTEAVRSLLVPAAALLTPNLDEAEALTGIRAETPARMEEAGRALLEMGAGAVLVKGGHLRGEPSDVLVTREKTRVYPGRRLVPGKVHGTGCTLASACAALMAAGYDSFQAVEAALRYLRGAIRDGFRREGGYLLGHFPGTGPGPRPRNATGFYGRPRFCPDCGGSLAGSEGHMDCVDCGLVYYRNPLPAVMVLGEDHIGRVLLVRRAFPPGEGMLCLPGGFMDLGEAPVECARRELMEETGLTADSMELAGSDCDRTHYGGVALFVFRARGLRGEPAPGDDASEVLWLPRESVPPLAFKAHERALLHLDRPPSSSRVRDRET